MRWQRLVPLAVLAAAALTVFFYSQNLSAMAEVGKPAPAFTLTRTDGATVTVPDPDADKPSLLYFWATWCIVCREEVYSMETFQERYGDRIDIHHINLRESPWLIEQFNGVYGIDKVSLLDRDGSVMERYRVTGTPERWLVDTDGVARFHQIGMMRFEALQQAYEVVTGRPIDGDGVEPLQTGQALLAAVARDGQVWLSATDATGVPLLFVKPQPEAAWQPLDIAATQPLVALRATATHVLGLSRGGDLLVWPLDDPQAQPIRYALPAEAAPFSALAVHDAAPQQLAAWSTTTGLWLSDDGGATWRHASSRQPVRENGADASTDIPQIDDLPVVNGLAFDPQQPGRFLAAAQVGLWESRDGGAFWQPVRVYAASIDPEDRIPWDNRFQRPLFDVAFSQTRPNQVYLATDYGVWVSDDNGRSFQMLRKSPARIVVSLDVAAEVAADAGADRLLVAAPNGDLYESDDGGAHWQRR